MSYQIDLPWGCTAADLRVCLDSVPQNYTVFVDSPLHDPISVIKVDTDNKEATLS